MRNPLRSLAFRIGSIIILIEAIVLSVVSFLYAERFSEQIDRRVEDRVKLVGTLVESSLVRLVSIREAEAMRLLVGEEVVDTLIIDARQGTVIFSLSGSHRGLAIDDVPGIETAWFDAQAAHKTLKRTHEGNNNFLISVTPLTDPISGLLSYFLYIKTSTDEAEQEKNAVARLLTLGSIGMILATSLAIFAAQRYLVLSKITGILRVLQRIEQGDLSARISGASAQDEIGTLQLGVNSMAARREQTEAELTRLNEQLEARVMRRTHELQTAADVSRQITTMLDIDQLLHQVVILTSRSFDLSYSCIFRWDEDKTFLRLETGADSAGVLLNKHAFAAIPINTVPSTVALAARTRQAAIINDAAESAFFLPHPLLQGVRSELALPMVYGERLLGVFDFQAQDVNRFGPDELRVLQSLAEQTTVAIRNAEHFSQAQAALREAERSNKVKSQFLASMSHELRTPLNAILNFSQFILTGMVGPVNEEQLDLLNKINLSGRHLLSLINDVLDISKIESGALRLFIENNIDLKKEFDVVAATARGLLAARSVDLFTEEEPEIPLISGDRLRIRQMMLNLVSNACKFTEAGTVSLSLKRQEHTVLFVVQDTGPGIAPDEQRTLFETFQQTEVGLRQGEGTGLGLAISRRLAEAHGGRLWVESVVGSGATFYLSLPIRCRESAQELGAVIENVR